jgi:hypothetical protein
MVAPRLEARRHSKRSHKPPQHGWTSDLILDHRSDAYDRRAQAPVNFLHTRQAVRLQDNVIVEERHEIGPHLAEREVALPRQTSHRFTEAEVPHPPRSSTEDRMRSQQLLGEIIRAGVGDDQLVRDTTGACEGFHKSP